MPMELFYSYSHKDEPLRDELDTHLALLRRRGVLQTWHDRQIAAGNEWRTAIDKHLGRADIVLLLVSPDFIASDYCYGIEMTRAIERHKAGLARVVPVIARSVDLEGAPFAEMQALPKDAKPVTSWPNRDEAWTDVAKGIRKVAEALTAAKAAFEPPVAAAPTAPADGTREGSPGADVTLTGSGAIAMGSGTVAVGRGGDFVGASRELDLRADAALDRALGAFQRDMVSVMETRGEHVDATDAWNMGERLAAITGWKRVLWVDDHPENNVHEVSALLAKLQIEVQTVTSTESALDALVPGREAFDLVITDWHRDPQRVSGLAEGVRLVRAMRERGLAVPVLCYHGVIPTDEFRRRREQFLAAGGQGTAFLPSDLLEQAIGLLGSLGHSTPIASSSA